MHLRAVLFDLDNTLHDKTATVRAFGEAQFRSWQLAASGVSLDDWCQEFIELNDLRIEKAEVFARLGARFSLPSELESTLLRDFDARLGSFAQACVGATDLLSACRRAGYRTGIVTNGRDAFQRSKIKALGFEPYLDSVVTSGGIGIKKPDPRIFQVCLAELGVHPTDAAFVGDDFASDMEPALALGMVAVWRSSSVSERIAFSSMSLGRIQDFLLPPSAV